VSTTNRKQTTAAKAADHSNLEYSAARQRIAAIKAENDPLDKANAFAGLRDSVDLETLEFLAQCVAAKPTIYDRWGICTALCGKMLSTRPNPALPLLAEIAQDMQHDFHIDKQGFWIIASNLGRIADGFPTDETGVSFELGSTIAAVVAAYRQFSASHGGWNCGGQIEVLERFLNRHL
jgi:hypothetical protein